MAELKSVSFLILLAIFTLPKDSNPLNEPLSASLSYGSPSNPDYPSTPMSSPPYRPTRIPQSNGIRAAYWPSWDGFPASSIDTSYFTHIYYAFLLPEPLTFKLNVTPLDQTQLPVFTSSLRKNKVPVMTLLSIGGAGNDPAVFSKMVSSKKSRAVFINSSIEVARKYGFDGVDLDWEFPDDDTDMSNLGLLYRQWRKALHHETLVSGTPRLLLTSAVYYAPVFINYGKLRSYPSAAMDRYLDWISPMCFDYYGSWNNFTGAHAALYDRNGNFSTSYGIESWIHAGVRPNKLVMGLPLYGHTWTLKDPNDNGIGAPTVGIGPGDQGFLNYNKIVEFNADNRAVVHFDARTVAYYSYADDIWIGYDDVRSVKLKVRFARSQGLAGYFFWALGEDQDWILSKQGKTRFNSLSLFTTL